MNPPPSSEMARPDKPTLTDFLRARTRFILEPIVEFLARYRLSPDALTVTGAVAHVFFAWLIARGHIQWAGLAIMLFAPLDSIDGALARKLGRKQGGFGAFLDSTLDRLAEVALFAGFIFYYAGQGNDTMVLTTYVALTGSLLVSYSRARAEALGLSAKIGLLSRVERYVVLVAAMVLSRPSYGLILIAIFTYITVAQRMFHVWQQSGREK
ncbi:MAG: CDP-alcohol phosphatidyltransferase family protein [Chloroflexota bacterium]